MRVTICIVIIQLCGHSVHNTTQHRSRPGTAKRVKLVEKGLPLSEEEQIKAKFPFKRSLEEISVGWKQEGDSSKKLRIDEIIRLAKSENVPPTADFYPKLPPYLEIISQ